VATNPAWDGPPIGNDDTATSGDRIATTGGSSSVGTPLADATSADETRGLIETETETEPTTSSTDAGDSSSSSEEASTGASGCPTGEQVCDGACVDISSDKHACGFYCVDCTVLFGNNAKCDSGFCHAHGGGGNDD
jgi:hypothetical protein